MSREPEGRHRPPRLAESLLRLSVPEPEAREGILGDLWEEYAQLAEERSHRRAALWYWLSVLRLSVRYTAHRVRPRRRPEADKSGGLGPGRAFPGAALVRDLTYAVRTLRRRPGLTVAAVLTLGIGIGASTTVFSVFNAIVLRPIPFQDPERLVRFSEVSPQGADFALSQPDFLDFRDGCEGVLELAAFQSAPTVFLRSDDTHLLSVALTTSDLFRVFRVSPALGRDFAPEEERPGAEAAVVILSHAFWIRAFDGDADVVGRTLDLSSGRYTVVGVMPPGFAMPEGVDVWLPRAPLPHAFRGDRRLAAFGRLRQGVPIERAREAASGVAGTLSGRYPDTNGGWGVQLIPLPEWIVGPQVRSVTIVLLSAVALLLLLICANISNLLMARTTARQRELGIRRSIGADRRRVVRQLVSESLLLGLMGAAVGIALACVLVPIVARQPEVLPRLGEVDLDWRVLAFAAVVSLGEGLAIGLAPAVQAARLKVQEALSESGGTPGAAERRIQDALVVGEIALAMALLVGAGLLGHSFLSLQRADRGFDPHDLYSVEVALPAGTSRTEMITFYEEALSGLREIPGVRGASGTSLRFFDLSPRLFTELGRVDQAPEDYVTSDWRIVTPEYFTTAGVIFQAGRPFQGPPQDADPVVIVNETLAGLLWPGENPLGMRLSWEAPGGVVTRVVGVVADVQDVHPALPQVASAYVPLGQQPVRAMTLLARADSDTPGLAAAMRREIRAASADATISEVRPLDDRYGDLLSQDRFLAAFLAIVAVVAVTLASLGIYSLVAFTVARRSQEIGIRMALGGRPESILAMVFSHGVRLVVVGVLLGTSVAVAGSSLLAAVLFQTAPTDLPIYVITGGVVVAVTLTATYLPARRVTRVDPKAVLVP